MSTPLPFVPNVVRIDYYWSETTPCGSSRIFMHYSGNPPTPSDLGAYLNVVHTSANIRFAPLLNQARACSAIRIRDLSSDVGQIAESTVPIVGTRIGTPLPLNCSVCLHFLIARTYKGGRPRISLPWLDEPDTTDGRNWNAVPLADAKNAFDEHIQEITVTSGAVTYDYHANVSYYSGSTGKVSDDGKRGKTIPTKRSVAKLDRVASTSSRTLMGSSRKRLKAHTGAP